MCNDSTEAMLEFVDVRIWHLDVTIRISLPSTQMLLDSILRHVHIEDVAFLEVCHADLSAVSLDDSLELNFAHDVT